MSSRVLLVDNHEAARAGLIILLQQAGFEVVGEAGSTKEAITSINSLNPDIVITDIQIPEVDGFIVLQTIREKGLKLKSIVYSSHENPTYIVRAIAWGADDFVLKSDPVSILLSSLSEIDSPDFKGSSSYAKMKEYMQVGLIPPDETASVTHRESQVLRHLVYGLSNREIGLSLGISVETVKEYVQSILRKLNIPTRTLVAVWAVRNKLA